MRPLSFLDFLTSYRSYLSNTIGVQPFLWLSNFQSNRLFNQAKYHSKHLPQSLSLPLITVESYDRIFVLEGCILILIINKNNQRIMATQGHTGFVDFYWWYVNLSMHFHILLELQSFQKSDLYR